MTTQREQIAQLKRQAKGPAGKPTPCAKCGQMFPTRTAAEQHAAGCGAIRARK